MSFYALELALRGLRRFPKSTALVIVTVALGISACVTTLTLLHVLSADPLPGRSQHLYVAWVDTVMARPPNSATVKAMAMDGSTPEGVGKVWRYIKIRDAAAMAAAYPAARQVIVGEGTANEVSADGLHADDQQTVLVTSSGFIPMFGVPMRFGRDWTPAEEKARDPVAVIDVQLAQRLFGSADAVGRSVRLNKTLFRVVGVMRRFEPEPHFYALEGGDFGTWENMYVPYTAALDAGLAPEGDSCDAAYTPHIASSGMGDPDHCASVELWARLDTPAEVAAYRTFLRNYVDQQRKALATWGKQPEATLVGVSRWLRQSHVVPDNVRANVWLAVAFLVLCMLNAVGLLAARFLRRGSEIGIRRALGAPRRAVFVQHILESSLICLLGGALAIPLTLLGLAVLRREDNFAGLAHLDPAMFFALIVLSVLVGALVGLFPAWRAARIEPGLQIKSE